jgi:hypothetical protein
LYLAAEAAYLVGGSPGRLVAPLFVPSQRAPVTKAQRTAGARKGALFRVHSLMLFKVRCKKMEKVKKGFCNRIKLFLF